MMMMMMMMTKTMSLDDVMMMIVNDGDVNDRDREIVSVILNDDVIVFCLDVSSLI